MLILLGPTFQVQTDHLKGTFCRLAASVNQNDQARDDRHICLDLDPVLLWGQHLEHLGTTLVAPKLSYYDASIQGLTWIIYTAQT